MNISTLGYVVYQTLGWSVRRQLPSIKNLLPTQAQLYHYESLLRTTTDTTFNKLKLHGKSFTANLLDAFSRVAPPPCQTWQG